MNDFVPDVPLSTLITPVVRLMAARKIKTDENFIIFTEIWVVLKFVQPRKILFMTDFKLWPSLVTDYHPKSHYTFF